MRHSDEKGIDVTPTEHFAKYAAYRWIDRISPIPGVSLTNRGSRALDEQHVRHGRVVLAVVCVWLCVRALGASAAPAAPPVSFCSLGTGAGHCDDPTGVAVDQSTGTVYVGDRINDRVDVFDSAGRFVRAFGWGVRNGAAEPQVCTTSCEAGVGGSGAGAINRPVGLAVDQSTHDVYVTDAEARVDEFNEKGEFVLMFGKAVDKTTQADVCTAVSGDTCGAGVPGSGPGEISNNLALAIDATGNIWVTDVERIERFSPGGVYLSEIALPADGTVQALAIDTDPLSLSYQDFYIETPSANEVQQITPPSSGVYTLTFEGQTTPQLAFDAIETEVQAALEALSAIGAGNVIVSESGLKVAFTKDLGERDLPPLEISAGSVDTLIQGVTGRLVKLNPAGEVLATLDEGGHPYALGLDPASGDLFVSDQFAPETRRGTATLLEFDPSGNQIESFATGQVIGGPSFNSLAFNDTAQRLYDASSASETNSAVQIFAVPPPGPLPLEGTSRVSEAKKTTVGLCTSVNSEGAETAFHYQYIAAKRFEEDGGSFGAGTLETAAAAALGGDFAVHVACQSVSGLTPDTTYRFRIVASNANGTVVGETASGETLPPAAINSTFVADVTSTAATLQAQINPLGDATSYVFQYIPETAYDRNVEEGLDPFTGAARAPASEAPLGAASEDVTVSQHVQGLVAHTAYRFRVLASNSLAPAGYPGPVVSFLTQVLGGPLVLPDAREWELVSPPDKYGAQLDPAGEGRRTLQASAAGDAVTYLASGPTEAGPQGFGQQAQVLSGRGRTGWSSRDINPLYSKAVGLSVDATEYRFFSADLSLGVLEPELFEPSLSAEANEKTPLLRHDFSPGQPTGLCVESCYSPLVDAGEVPEGTQFSPQGGAAGAPAFRGATADLAHVLLESKIPLTQTALPAKAFGLYEWSAGRSGPEALSFVSVLPDGKPASGAELGGGSGQREETRGSAISADGSRVVWIDSHLYLRYNATEPQSAVNGSGECVEPDKACTVQLDAVQGGSGSGVVQPAFQFASSDGSRVFFSDPQRLTADSGAEVAKSDLYECELVMVEEKLQCDLSDVTPVVSGEPAVVQGSVLGGSRDGSSVYFVANGVLSGEEQNEHGEKAHPGGCSRSNPQPGVTCNLYVLRDGKVRFVAALGVLDGPDWAARALTESGTVTYVAARVSPNGRWLAFVSQRPLTGYDTRDAVTGKPDEEVYLYDSQSGRLRCASCDPTGARPIGEEVPTSSTSPDINFFLGGNRSWDVGQALAAMVPGWTRPGYQSRYLSDEGRLFFETFGALVPQDSNGTWDVYQYEQPGVGDCTVSNPLLGDAAGGCVGLISSGVSPSPSAFIDASESGNDVFFYTSAALAAQDTDTSRDLYDAHSCSVLVPCLPSPSPPSPVCEGDACQARVSAPEDPTPGSLTYRAPSVLGAPGPVSVKPKTIVQGRAVKLARALRVCAGKPRRKRAACRRAARRTYGPAAGRARKPNQSGKGGR